jgi:hypothetical protein
VIYSALKLIRDELGAFIVTRNGQDEEVVLGNVALLESPDNEAIQDRILISLVNIEEESALKNFKTYQRDNASGIVENVNPTVHLNLYILFSANYQVGNQAYINALKRLSNVIQFFQAKNVFTMSNSTHADLADLSHNEDLNQAQINDIKLIFDLYTLTFEQINHLWGALGGKQIPFAMYKCRLIKIADSGIKHREPVIEEVNANDEAI